MRRGVVAAHLDEGLEDRLELVRRDSGAIILDSYANRVVVFFELERDVTVLRRELDRVGQKIDENLPHLVGIATDLCLWNLVTHRELKPFLPQLRLDEFAKALYHLSESHAG